GHPAGRRRPEKPRNSSGLNHLPLPSSRRRPGSRGPDADTGLVILDPGFRRDDGPFLAWAKASGSCSRIRAMDEVERRKAVIAGHASDRTRWADPGQLEAAWEPRAKLAARFVPAGARVLDIGCGAMALERHLPAGCSYQPCDLVARD